MAKIEDQYELKVNSGGLDRFIEKAERGNRLTQALGGAMGRLARISEALSGSVRGIIREQHEAERSARNVSAATRELVEQLEPLETAFRSALTDGERDRALDTLTRKMERLGLVWTTEFGNMNRADLLRARSLQELSLSGDLTANSLAEAARAGERTDGVFKRLAAGAGNLARKMLGLDRARAPLEGITNKLLRMGATLFTARKLMQYIRSAGDRAPDEIAGSFAGLQSGISDAGTRAIVSLMKGMQGGVDRLLRSMNSPAGQKFFRGLERSADAAGRVVGKALDLIGGGIEWIGDHGETAFTIAGVALAFFAAQMLAAGAATAAASWPILLILGLTAALVAGLMKAGYTAEDIFWWIGAGAGFLYALVYNIVVDLYNLFATFAEFFANVFNDPVSAVAHLFIDTFDVILSMVETAAKAIDRLTGSNLAAGIANLRSGLQSWADQTFGKNEIKIARMDKISYTDMMSAWAEKVAGLGSQLSDFSLSNALAQTIKAIAGDTNAIRKSVQLSEEDLRSLVDVAERRYVNHISLTSQTPVITVNGANTGRTAEDRQALADAIAEVLIEQTASGSTVDARTPT